MSVWSWWQSVTQWARPDPIPPAPADVLGAATLPHVVMAQEDRGRAVPQAALEVIARWEGYRAQAYLCPADVWTIGYGTTRYPDGRRVKAGDVTTQSAAMALLRDDAGTFAAEVDRMVDVALNANERAALISLAYNIGGGALKASTLVRLLNSGDREGAAKQFSRWNKGGGRVLAGLVARRADEVRLFRGL